MALALTFTSWLFVIDFKHKSVYAHFLSIRSNQKRFFLSYEKCLPFEMAKIFPSANGKNFCHFKLWSVILFSIYVVNWAFCHLFSVKLIVNIAWKRNIEKSFLLPKWRTWNLNLEQKLSNFVVILHLHVTINNSYHNHLYIPLHISIYLICRSEKKS